MFVLPFEEADSKDAFGAVDAAPVLYMILKTAPNLFPQLPTCPDCSLQMELSYQETGILRISKGYS